MNRIIIYIVLLSLTLTSCSDFLEQEPGSQTSIDEIYSSYAGFKMALNGAYRDFESIASGERNAICADLLGGNINFTPSQTKNSISIPSKIENVYSFADKADDSDMEILYDDAYNVINLLNQILERLGSISDATDDQISQLKAEALSMRALAHFLLVKYYAQNYAYTSDASHLGIICNTQPQKVGVDYPGRKTVKETYEIIIRDLQDALTYFKSTNVLPGATYSYFTATSCKALLARVALYAHEYQLAIDYSSDVILNSGIRLMTKDEYVNEWKKPNMPVSEIIFELSAKQDDEGSFQTGLILSGYYGLIESVNDYKKYCASNDLMSLYEEGDVRGSQMFITYNIATQKEDEVELVEIPYAFTCKFQDNPGNPMLRMSELYLIRAEAYARLNEPENALTDLNTLREQRGAALAQLTDDLLEEVFLERRKELCFERHLFFDIARFQKNVERNAGCIASTCNLNYPSNYFVLPIPKNNIELNSNLKQNEGYN